MSHPGPISVGEKLSFTDGTTTRRATVLAVVPWDHILLRAEDGSFWVEVMMSASAASWSRLVELAPGFEATDTAALQALVRSITHSPRRTDVIGINGARRLCPSGARLIRET